VVVLSVLLSVFVVDVADVAELELVAVIFDVVVV